MNRIFVILKNSLRLIFEILQLAEELRSLISVPAILARVESKVPTHWQDTLISFSMFSQTKVIRVIGVYNFLQRNIYIHRVPNLMIFFSYQKTLKRNLSLICMNDHHQIVLRWHACQSAFQRMQGLYLLKLCVRYNVWKHMRLTLPMQRPET